MAGGGRPAALCPAYFSRHKSNNRIKPNPINFHEISPQTMSSTYSPPKITIPIVSPPRPSSSPKVTIGSPTCVGRTIDFDDHLIGKENKKNSSGGFASVAVVSPPPKKIKYSIDANIVAKRASASGTSTSTPTKIYALDRHSCGELKSILGMNGQHISGLKEELLARVIDGEKYGPLKRCPICRFGRLKVRPHHQDIVFCPGYYDTYYECHQHCGFITHADDAPRGKIWYGPKLRYIEVHVPTPTEKIMTEYKKKEKKELSDLLIAKGQNGKGPKKHLLPRIVDAKLRGLLAQPCPDCHHGILQVKDNATGTVVCSRSPKKCKYQPISVADAPRSGQWDA